MPDDSPGGGGRFQAMVEALQSEGKGADRAKAIAAGAGRRKYGKRRFQKMAARGRRRAARRRARKIVD